MAKEVSKALLGKNLSYDFANQIIETTRDILMNVYSRFYNNMSKENFTIYFQYVSGGAIQVVREWANSDFVMSIDSLSKKLEDLFSASLVILSE